MGTTMARRSLGSQPKSSSPMPKDLERKGYGADGQRRGIHPKHHVMRGFGYAPAFDKRAIDVWKLLDVRVLKAIFVDGSAWWIPLEDFIREAVCIDYGHGPQFVAQRLHWHIGR